MKTIIWCLFVILASLTLIYSIFSKSVIATILCVIMCIVLRKTMNTIAIPDTYKKRGISNKMFK